MKALGAYVLIASGICLLVAAPKLPYNSENDISVLQLVCAVLGCADLLVGAMLFSIRNKRD